MTDINTTLPEIDQQRINPNEEIKSLIGSVDISSFTERLDTILNNPVLKESLLQTLKENQPITGKLLLKRIIETIVEVQVDQKEVQVKEINKNRVDYYGL
jgi:hypothetical protein